MFNLFPASKPKYATYVKMYSTFTHVNTEKCFAFVLLPYSIDRSLIHIESIQFDFNRSGEILGLSIHFLGEEETIHQKAKETQASFVKLKEIHTKGNDLCVFDPSTSRLSLLFAPSKNSPLYLLDIINHIAEQFSMNPAFVKEIKDQLLSPFYLASEHERLSGRSQEKPSECAIV
ncbi:hypothetical protein [Legionella waltersii]|uniref:Uncharacterized protein n=1 Tax=Legionella waltersii TaxID=66969 RepID=A0A0W1A741_9GAMM|nr:hypothetical protein [Legionella waltersii]KTD77175.1 hypothetical protein Lwal_1952 [Legionella waltersii]SNV11342.1 Uncharacterised protein [Legionella waltersii]